MSDPASPTATSQTLYDVMHERGLVAQCTDEKIRERLSKPVVAYCGFDPTADSLHVGSLVPIMGLAWMQRMGHKPIVLVGGATGLVGDPSGKTEARQMLTAETIQGNANAIAQQIGRFVTFGDNETDAKLVNNLDWIGPMSWLEVLRDVGSRVSVNRMVTMESVKQRMAPGSDGSGGISYLEFSYMLLQAMDFAHLNEKEGCTLQIGGQDQWGNIVMGIELSRKMHDADVAGLTFPLVTKADGSKFGKSEAGNVWLDPARTSPYDFYQFWRNVDDSEVGRFLGYFTFMPMDQVNKLASAEGSAINASKQVLAYEITKLVHGEEEANKARESATKAFEAGDVTGDAIPHADLDLSEPKTLRDLMFAAKFTSSGGEAKRLVAGGGVRLHDEKASDPMQPITAEHVTDGYILLRVGKKKLFRFDVS